MCRAADVPTRACTTTHQLQPWPMSLMCAHAQHRCMPEACGVAAPNAAVGMTCGMTASVCHVPACCCPPPLGCRRCPYCHKVFVCVGGSGAERPAPAARDARQRVVSAWPAHPPACIHAAAWSPVRGRARVHGRVCLCVCRVRERLGAPGSAVPLRMEPRACTSLPRPRAPPPPSPPSPPLPPPRRCGCSWRRSGSPA